jgi:predicted  nucleic acid-binding Zn-ribbon protein
MVCSMVKKGLLGAALGAGALYLVFGTSAPSYVRTAFHKVRHNAKSAVPVQFEIDKTREEIASLEPAIKDNIETYARAEVDVEHLEREILATKDNLGVEKRAILTLRDQVKSGDYRLAKHGDDPADELKCDLARRLDHYTNVERILQEKQATLTAKQKALAAARKQLDSMSAQKKALTAKLDGIEARLKAIEATQTSNEFDFDDRGALSRAKASVADLEKRLEIMARKAEYEGRYVDAGVPIGTDHSRNVINEIDTKFGPAAPTEPKTGDKSL